MRYEIVITLIFCGTLLVLAPPVSDHFASKQLTDVLVQRLDMTRFSSSFNPMSPQYRFGCWLLGTVMIGMGVGSEWLRGFGSEWLRGSKLDNELDHIETRTN